MLNMVSLLIGVAGLAWAAFLPFSGNLNWLLVPLAMAGAIIGMSGRRTTGRDLNMVVVVLGLLRLSLGDIF